MVTLGPATLGPASELPPHVDPVGTFTIAQLVRNHVLSVIVQTKGDKTAAARLLGISRRNIYRLIKLYEKSCSRCGGMNASKRNNGSHIHNCPGTSSNYI